MLQLFKPVPVVSETHACDNVPARAHAYVRDTITLGWEERLKARGRRRSDNGSEFATALPRGTVLRAGDALVVDEIGLVAVVVDRNEPVFVVRPKDAAEWGRFGYYIGNSHQPVMFTDEALVCADLPGMAQILDQHGIPFTRETRPFTPVSGVADHRHTG